MRPPEKIEGKKKVEVFLLSSESDRTVYEDLLNNDKILILREEFVYNKNGNPVITVWYVTKN